jgi:uncharacterized protein (DUF1810 family)
MIMDEELRKKLIKRFQKADPELYKAVVDHLDNTKGIMNQIAQQEMDAIQARTRWIEKYKELAEECQKLIDQNKAYSQLKNIEQHKGNEEAGKKTNPELLEDIRFLVFHLQLDDIFQQADQKLLTKMITLYIQDYEKN